MENILTLALILSLAFNIMQGYILWKMAGWIEKDTPPF
jgi:hypothetical protein